VGSAQAWAKGESWVLKREEARKEKGEKEAAEAGRRRRWKGRKYLAVFVTTSLPYIIDFLRIVEPCWQLVAD
jgi:hypothetical protein